jgi:hypothetical protein
MNPKNTLLLVILAAGMFAFIFFFERHRDLSAPAIPKLLPGLDIAAVTNIQIQLRGKDEAIRLERTTNGTWQLIKPINYPAQSLAVDNLLKALQDLTPQDHISAEDLKGRRNVDADFGMQTPTATIVVTQSGDERTLNLGNFTAPGDQIYAHVVGVAGMDIVSTNVFQFMPRQVDDWRDTLFLSLPGRGVFDRINVTNGTKTFTLQNDETNSSWRILPHDRVNIARLAALFVQLAGLRVEKFVSDKTNADLEPYGLQPPELQLDFDRGTNHMLALQFGKSPTNNPDLVYARRDDQSTVVLVSADVAKRWRAEKVEFRDRTLAGMYTWLPDEISVTGSNNFTVRRITNDSWQVTAPYTFPADTNLIKQYITKLARLAVVPTNGPIAVKDIVPPSEWTNYGLATPAWKYVLKSTVTNAAGVSNVVMAEMDFGAVSNNDTLFARRPEEPSVYAVSLADFKQLPVSGFQLRERRIWDFTPDQVSRIIVRQDDKPMELLHRAPNDWTLAVGSQGVINPLTIEVGASELGELAAENFVERGAEKQANYGFTDKSLQISVYVSKGGQTETLSVVFGGWSPRGLRYGMVELAGQKWIFEFPNAVQDGLMSYFNIHEDAPAGASSGQTATNAPAK